MKTDMMIKLMGATACACLVLAFSVRAEEGASTNAPARHHRGPGGELGGGNGEEMQKLREKLKDMTPEQRQEAIKKFREKMGARGGEGGGEAWREKMKDMTPEQRREAMQKMGEKMKERIEQSDKLTAEQKKELLAHMEKMKVEREKIMNDSKLTEEQKREAMQKLREKSREMLEKYREALGGGQGQHKEGGPAKAGGQKPVEAKPSV